MGTEQGNLPPLPAGYVLDQEAAQPEQQAAPQESSSLPPLPSGYVLENQPSAQHYPSGQEVHTGDYQIKKNSPIINIITAGQKPGTITHHNPITPLPGEDFNDTMKRAIDAAKSVTPEQIKEDQDESLMETPGTLASATALGATGPVVYGGVKGVSILKQAILGGDSQILGHPENLLTPETRKAHPYWAGALETVGGLSSPENAAMIIGSGALNKLPGPASKMVSRLVSGGFGITMLSSAVRNVPELWDVMQGTGKYAGMPIDDRESLAKNMVFHSTVDAAMGAHALEHGVAGESHALTGFGEKADTLTAQGVQKAVNAVKTAPSAAINLIGSALGRTNDFDTAIKRSSKIPAKQVAGHMEKIANVREDLQAILNESKDVIEDPKTFGKEIDKHIQEHEAKLQKEAGATKGSDEPVVSGLMQRLTDRLDTFFDDHKGLYGDETQVAEAKKKILEGVLQSRNGQHLLEPNLFEAENVRRRLNRDASPQYATNATPTTDAYKAGAAEAAYELRQAIDESYESKGVQNVKEFRQKEANLISVRDRLYDAQDKAEKMGEGTVFQSLIKKIGVPSSVIAIALGHPISGAAIGAAVLGDQIVQNVSNPSVNINRAIDIAGRNPNSRMTEPSYNQSRVNSPIHGALASHYGELIGQSTYPELQGRFMAEIAAKAQRGSPLEPAEKALLTKLNEANIQDAEKAKAEAEKQAQIQAEAMGQAASANGVQQLVVNPTLPADAEHVMDVPKDMPNGMTVQQGIAHDIAHAVVANETGVNTVDGIRSHLHPENSEAGSLMSTPLDWSDLTNEDGSLDFDKMKHKIDDIATTYVAGGVANDLWHGISFTENHGLGADLSILRKFMKFVKMSDVEASRVIARAADRAREILSRPGVRETIEGHADVREPDLDEKYHLSQERLEQVLQDIKEGSNEGLSRKSSESARNGNGPNEGDAARGKKESSRKPENGVVKPVTEGLGSKSKTNSEGKTEAPETDDNGNTVPDLRGAVKIAAEKAKAKNPKLSSTATEPELAYRARPVGEQGVPVKRRPVATSSLESARAYADQLQKMSGKPHEVVQIPLKGQEYSAHEGPNEGETWFKFNKEVPETSVKRGVQADNPKLSSAVAEPPAKEERLPKIENLRIPQERTTGQYDTDIKQGGGVPGGIQKGDPEIDLPDYALFHDPTTGSTLALPVDKISPENVKSQLRKSREQYIAAEDREAAISKADVSTAADEFNRRHGRPAIDSNTKPHNPEFAKRVADAYERMQHNPSDPKVKASYTAMKSDVDAQWDYATKQMGMKFEPWTKEGQPYANSKEMVSDVNNNKHLYFFQGGESPVDNPMQQIDPKTGLSYNDKFRAVHDLFGHAAQGNQFGPKGEEVAYQLHRQMFTPAAIPALTSETRGQNSWVNFGKHLRDAEGNVPEKGQSGFVPQTQRPYAEQKSGLLPEEFHGAGPGWADQINLKTDPSGAIDPKTGSMTGKRYGFEVYPEARETLDHPPTAQDFRAFEQKNAGLLQKHPELRVGWDTLGDKPEINIGVSTDNLEAAKKAASALDQRSIWDTQQKKEIPTGGGNKQQAFENYPLEQRLAGLNHVQPENPKLSTAVAEPEREETYHPDLQKLADRFGTTTDPRKVRNGASFIAPDGKFINLGSVEHPVAIDQMTDRGGDPEAVGAKVARSENTEIHDPVTNKFTPVDNRIGFMKDTGAIRTRFRDSMAGRELVASVPAKGVTPEQIQALQQAVGQGLGRNGNLLIEVGESGGKSSTKEFASPRDVEPMLREIGAMKMTAENPKLSAEEWTPPAGLEKGISKDEAVETEIPLSKISVGERQYNQAASNYFRKQGSKTEGPVSIVYNPDNGQYLVEDGMHRIVQAHQEGKQTIPAKLWSGYSDVANVLPEHKMDLSPIEDEESKPENPKLSAEESELKKGEYYHITPTKNVPNILKEGLLPARGPRSGQLESQNGTFLFKSKKAAEDALMNWLGDEFPEDEPLSVLKVKSGSVSETGADYEVVAEEKIHPKDISHLGDVDDFFTGGGAKPENPKLAAEPKKKILSRIETLNTPEHDLGELDQDGPKALWENWAKAQPFTAHKDGFMNIGETHEAAYAQHEFKGKIPEDFDKWEDLARNWGDEEHARGWAAKDGSRMFLWDNLKEMLEDKNDIKWPALKNVLRTLAEKGMAKPETKLWDQGGDNYLGTLQELGLNPKVLKPENPKLGYDKSGTDLEREARNYYPEGDKTSERSYVLTNGDILDVADNDHYQVQELYPERDFDEGEGIDQFINDTGALRVGKYEQSFLIHGGNIAPNDGQLKSVMSQIKHWGPEIKDKYIIETPYGQKDLPDFATPAQIRRTLEDFYKGVKPENPKLAARTQVRPKGSTVGLMDNPLDVKAAGGAEKPSTVDVAMALSKYTKKQLPALQMGKAEPEEMVKRAKTLAEDEARYQLAQNNSGEAWYTRDIAEHDKTLQAMRPELENPAKLSLFKMVEAVLSSGQKPYANFKTTVKAWDYYNDTGKFPEFNPESKKSWGPRGIKAYGNAIDSINRLISEKGEQGASDWLLADHSVSELKSYNEWVEGKADDRVPGVMILGPKRGPFAQNLHGKESAFTADMWVARTWNRWMGTTDFDPNGGKNNEGEITTDSPRSNKERNLMKQSFQETAKKLKLTTSALQAVLWYYEQALYNAHGASKESWNFADAAKRASDEEFNTFKFGEPEEEQPGLAALAGRK